MPRLLSNALGRLDTCALEDYGLKHSTLRHYKNSKKIVLYV